jgi:hypothetical protein
MNIYRKTLPGMLAVTCIAISALIAATGPEAAFQLPEAKLEAEIKDRLPMQRKAGPAEVDVSNVLVDMKSDGLINLRIASTADGPGVAGVMLIEADVGLSWDRGEIHGENFEIIYVDYSKEMDPLTPGTLNDGDWDVVKEEMSILNNIAPSGASVAERGLVLNMASIMEAVVVQRLAEQPVFDTETLGWKGKIGKQFVKDISITENALRADLTFSNKVVHGVFGGLALIMGLLHLLCIRRKEKSAT